MGLDAYRGVGTEWGVGMLGTRGWEWPRGEPVKPPGGRRTKYARSQTSGLSEGGPETHRLSSYSRESELSIS